LKAIEAGPGKVIRNSPITVGDQGPVGGSRCEHAWSPLNYSGVKNCRLQIIFQLCGSLRLRRRGEVMPNRQFNLTYFSPKIEKRISPIQGRGLFAKTDIEKGEVVVVKGGYVLTKANATRSEENSGLLRFRLLSTSSSAPRAKTSAKAA